MSRTLLVIFAVTFAFPLIWMVANSLKPGSEVFTSPPSIVGSSVQWSNYMSVWTYAPFATYLLNSLLVSTLGTVLVLFTSLLAAYAFSRLQFRGRNAIFFGFLATLMVPQEAVVIPMYILMDRLGWVNTFAGLVVPWAFSAFGPFLLRQALLTVPKELEEAATLDGARHGPILFRIMTPIIAPSIAVLAIFTFIGYWNSFLWPLIVVSDDSTKTISLGLKDFMAQGGTQWELIMAGATISMVPTAVFAIILQRHLVRGISMGSGLGGQ